MDENMSVGDAATVKMTSEELASVQRKELNIKINLGKLVSVTRWKQKLFADITGVSAAQLSKYINPNREDIPSLDYLIKLCELPRFKSMGLTLDMLASDSFDPIKLEENLHGKSDDEVKTEHDGFCGNYIGYTLAGDETDRVEGGVAPLRLCFCILSVYKGLDHVSGETVLRASVARFKPHEYDRAQEMKNALDRVFKSTGSLYSRIDRVEKIFSAEGICAYDGSVDFGEEYAYIHARRRVEGDQALFILSANRKGQEEYIGGLGSMAAVSHESESLPLAQRILFSRYRLICSEELIAAHLSVPVRELSTYSEAEEVGQFCRELYDERSFLSGLSDEDKTVMIRRRLDLLARKYTERHISAIGSITRREDEVVVAIIRQSAD